MERFTFDKISQWVSEVNTLSSITISQPHAAYTCFTHGLFSRRLYVTRIVPDTSSSFQSLEKTLLTKFIPALTGLDPPGALQRSLFALPTRFGGLGIVAPDSLSFIEFSASMYITAPYDHSFYYRILAILPILVVVCTPVSVKLNHPRLSICPLFLRN